MRLQILIRYIACVWFWAAADIQTIGSHKILTMWLLLFVFMEIIIIVSMSVIVDASLQFSQICLIIIAI
jgi:hypothetical protein